MTDDSNNNRANNECQPWELLKKAFKHFPLTILKAITTSLILEEHLLIDFTKQPYLSNNFSIEGLLEMALRHAFNGNIITIFGDQNMTPEQLSTSLEPMLNQDDSIEQKKDDNEDISFQTIILFFNLDLCPTHTQMTMLEIMKLRKLTLTSSKTQTQSLPSFHHHSMYPTSLPSFHHHNVGSTDRTRQVSISSQFLVFATRRHREDIAHSISHLMLEHFLLELLPNENLIPTLGDFISHKVDNDNTTNAIDFTTLSSILSQLRTLEKNTELSHSILLYLRDIIVAIRQHPRVAIGPSPQGASIFRRIAKIHAILCGSSFTRPVDVDVMAVDSLSHRMLLRHHEQNVSRSIVAHLVFNVLKPPK